MRGAVAVSGCTIGNAGVVGRHQARFLELAVLRFTSGLQTFSGSDQLTRPPYEDMRALQRYH